jgi:small subunit ribosomal protein S18
MPPTKDEIKFLSNPKIGQKRSKYCRFRKFGIRYIDYKDADFLLQFITGNSLKYQRKVAEAVKKARQLALLPYVADLLK